MGSTFTYTGDPSVSDVAAVRFTIKDTDPNNALCTDQEIEWCILEETGSAAAIPQSLAGYGLYASAARAMEALQALWAMQADTEQGSVKVQYSKQAGIYALRAAEMRIRAQGYHAPYAGGLSESEKFAFASDPDRVQPFFTRTQFDNPWAGSSEGYSTEALGPPIVN